MSMRAYLGSRNSANSKDLPWFLKSWAVKQKSTLRRRDFFELLGIVNEKVGECPANCAWNQQRDAAIDGLKTLAENYGCTWRLNEDGADICIDHRGKPSLAVRIGGYSRGKVERLLGSKAIYRGIVTILPNRKTFFIPLPTNQAGTWEVRQAYDFVDLIEWVKQHPAHSGRALQSMTHMSPSKTAMLLDQAKRWRILSRKPGPRRAMLWSIRANRQLRRTTRKKRRIAKNPPRFPRLSLHPHARIVASLLRASYNRIARTRDARKKFFRSGCYDVCRTVRGQMAEQHFLILANRLLARGIDPWEYVRAISNYGNFQHTTYLPPTGWLCKHEAIDIFEWLNPIQREENDDREENMQRNMVGPELNREHIVEEIEHSARLVRNRVKMAEERGEKLSVLEVTRFQLPVLSPWFLALNEPFLEVDGVEAIMGDEKREEVRGCMDYLRFHRAHFKAAIKTYGQAMKITPEDIERREAEIERRNQHATAVTLRPEEREQFREQMERDHRELEAYLAKHGRPSAEEDEEDDGFAFWKPGP
jgi:hypothetical protein